MNQAFWKGKRVLVTGGTGSFGTAFVGRLLAETKAARIIVLSRDEFKQQQMSRVYTDPRLGFFIGDVRDKDRLVRAFDRIDIVVHAAALKQVPALEYNPLEAVKTNVLGTQNVIDAALDRGVERVMLVSTDKAVHPINLYGATKLTAERLVVASNAYRNVSGKPRFSVVRYGNVIGSRGSFIELLRSGPSTIPITHELMTRFWIDLIDVTKVVAEAIEQMEGGEIFVPKMTSFKIVDVVKALVPKAKITIVGIRPGEKLHEALLTEHEAERTKDAGDFYVVLPEFQTWDTKGVFNTKKPFPKNSRYASDHKNFLRGAKEVKKVIKL